MFKRRMRHEAKPAALLDGARLGTTPQDSRPALRNGYTSYICSWIPANIAYNMQQVYTHLYIYIYTHTFTLIDADIHTHAHPHTQTYLHIKNTYTHACTYTRRSLLVLQSVSCLLLFSTVVWKCTVPLPMGTLPLRAFHM
jgi:hypothetical protein